MRLTLETITYNSWRRTFSSSLAVGIFYVITGILISDIGISIDAEAYAKIWSIESLICLLCLVAAVLIARPRNQRHSYRYLALGFLTYGIWTGSGRNVGATLVGFWITQILASLSWFLFYRFWQIGRAHV